MSPHRTWTDAMRGRVATEDGERGSLPFLMLVMVLTAALGAVLLNTVLQQTRTSRFDASRVQALDAAQGGLDYGLARIRAAVESGDTASGDPSKLPCGTEWTDLDADLSGTSTFSVRVRYYVVNPENLNDVQRGTGETAGTKQMVCSDSAGTYDKDTNSRIPRFALIESTGKPKVGGTGRTRGRTMETTYVLQTNDVNISGGQIAVYTTDASSRYCMDAGSADPVEGTQLKLRKCSESNPAAEQQVFSYRSDLSIELVSSAKAPTAGLCIDTEPTSHVAGRAMVLKRCGAADYSAAYPNSTALCPAGVTPTEFATRYPGKQCKNSPWSQRWSIDDSAHLRGSLTDESNTDGFCIEAPSQTDGAALSLQSCAGSVQDTKQTWVPTPTTGAGAAGPGNNQLVNFAQFATCVDVTGANVAAGHMILYTCKQNPNPNRVLWNQKFTPSPALGTGPTTTTLTTGPAGNLYCLVSPLTDGGYPTLKLCAVATNAEKNWVVNQRYVSGATGAAELSYANRYTIKDSQNRCLSLGRNSDLFNFAYYKLVTTGCDGSTAQKWNADPSNLKATLQNTRERGPTSGS